jgi:hypothetical protein
MHKEKTKRKIKYLKRLDHDADNKVFKLVVIVLSFLFFLSLLIYILYDVCLELSILK